LNDVFYHLLKQIIKKPKIITPREAVLWGKQNLKPKFIPGDKHFYTDTNYYLLGLIIERVTQKSYHKVLHELIFDPLDMENAFMYGYSEPRNKSNYPTAKLYINNINV